MNNLRIDMTEKYGESSSETQISRKAEQSKRETDGSQENIGGLWWDYNSLQLAPLDRRKAGIGDFGPSSLCAKCVLQAISQSHPGSVRITPEICKYSLRFHSLLTRSGISQVLDLMKLVKMNTWSARSFGTGTHSNIRTSKCE